MADDVYVYVTVPEGRRTPIHKDDGKEPGGKQLHVLSGTVSRVKWSQNTRRSVNRHDLVLCKRDGTPVETFGEAISKVDDLGAHRVDINHTIVRNDLGKFEVRRKMTIATVTPPVVPNEQGGA